MFSGTTNPPSDAGKSMFDKREQYRAEIRRLQHRNRQKLHRMGIISTSILNAFQQLEGQLLRLIAEGQVQELKGRIEHLVKEVKEFEGEICPQQLRLLQMLAKTMGVNLRMIHYDENDDQEEELVPQSQRHRHQLLLPKPQDIDEIVQEVLLLMCSPNLSYKEYPLERLQDIINNVWILFESSQPSSLKLLLNFLMNILLDREDLLSTFKQLGLPRQLCDILRANDPGLRSSLSLIMSLATQYTRLQSRQSNNSKIVDITSIMLNNEQRNYFLTLSLQTVESNDPQLIELSLALLRELTELNSYLCEFFSHDHHVRLLQLVVSSNMEISRVALEVIDNLIYFTNDSCSSYFMENGVLNVLLQLIDRQENVLRDKYQSFRLTKIMHIVHNLMNTKAGMRGKLKAHPIIERIYRCIYPGSRLLILGKIFETYFRGTQQHVGMAIMETLFQSIATLDLRNSAIPEHLTYKNIVLEIYREARIYWRDQFAVEAAIERHNLMWIFEEVE